MLHFPKKYYPVRNVIFFFGESLLIFITINLAYIGFTGWRIYCLEVYEDVVRAFIVTIVFQMSLYFFDLYDFRRGGTATDTFVRMMQSFGIGCIILAGLYYVFPFLIISTKIFWSGYLVICGALLGWRVLYYSLLEKRLFAQPVLIVGTGKIASEITSEIEDGQDSGDKVAAFIGETPPLHNPRHSPVIPLSTSLPEACTGKQVGRVIVALDDRRGVMPVKGLLDCKVKGVDVEDGITFYEAITGKILVENVNPAWLIFSEGFQSGRLSYFVKRVLDIFLAVIGLIVTSPVSAVTSLLIKIESPGPVFYTQERVGERGESFSIIKFRSMREDAEKDGAVWAVKNDPRVTKVGAFIRKVRIDEIPQMWNVLKGEMSFVGPRPERPVFVEKLTANIPYYSLRHTAKPGITGWAQVCYPYGASEEDALRKLEYDLYYIKNQSIFIDLLVVFRTVKTVLFRVGSR
ncbi:MAG: TIGR03013 family PEP-CTERM/XrtA system glycosyltransferase [Desulfobulbaceae bacterium]|nr:TIGR03013 family PEP-CTERM/XrtA system glycosyltransferase [Desulfobulbaceae bacterium]